eukprot:1048950-Prymnesium_polylepis.1
MTLLHVILRPQVALQESIHVNVPLLRPCPPLPGRHAVRHLPQVLPRPVGHKRAGARVGRATCVVQAVGRVVD